MDRRGTDQNGPPGEVRELKVPNLMRVSCYRSYPRNGHGTCPVLPSDCVYICTSNMWPISLDIMCRRPPRPWISVRSGVTGVHQKIGDKSPTSMLLYSGSMMWTRSCIRSSSFELDWWRDPVVVPCFFWCRWRVTSVREPLQGHVTA